MPPSVIPDGGPPKTTPIHNGVLQFHSAPLHIVW